MVLRLSSNMIRNSNDETNFPHKLLLTDRQVASLRKLFLTIYKLILNYENLNYLRWNNQDNFLIFLDY